MCYSLQDQSLAGMQAAQHCALACLQLRNSIGDWLALLWHHLITGVTQPSLGVAIERTGCFTYCFFLFRLLTTHSCSTSCVGKQCLITSKYLLNYLWHISYQLQILYDTIDWAAVHLTLLCVFWFSTSYLLEWVRLRKKNKIQLEKELQWF